MFITVITDCNDTNASARQSSRWASLFDAPVSIYGVDNYNEYEAAAHVIDVLDAGFGNEGIVFINVAPRHGKGKKWPNGTPFAYFYYKKTLVISTIDGFSLSLIKKLGLTDSVNMFDIPTAVDFMINQNYLEGSLRDHIVDSQFRSFEFVPRVARLVWDTVPVPTEYYSLDHVENIPQVVTFADNFGNCPTSILPEEIGFEAGKVIQTKYGELTCYNRLKDVPDGEPALIIGSWGIEDKRFVAIVVQGKSAAKHFSIGCGAEIF